MMEWIILGAFVAVVIFFFAGLFDALSPPSYHPMPPDEEIEWLMRDHNMTREEAEKMVNLPRR